MNGHNAASIAYQKKMRDMIVGLDGFAPLLDGTLGDCINFDNAASTPPFKDVLDVVNEFSRVYSSVHRGTGFKSRLSTHIYDEAHEIIGHFVGADLETNTVIFGKNTTEAINKIAYRINYCTESVILTTLMEHHSNDLPWRNQTNVVYVETLEDGRIDIDDFDKKLSEYADSISLVALSGASNVTGFIQPIHELARKAHRFGAKILVDCAQLAPHRRIDMKPDSDPEHLDFVVLSGHKMYAPYGTGALIGPKNFFLQSAPEYCGGGVVDSVTLDHVHWADLPDRDEAGSPNVVGAVAMATAAKIMMTIGMEEIAKEEENLTAYALAKLSDVPELILYGDTNPDNVQERVGVIPFNIKGMPHALAAAIMGYEGGISVRNGCFCAHPYVVNLLKLSQEENLQWSGRAIGGDKKDLPGMVRLSFGCYNTCEEVDTVVFMLQKVAKGEFAGTYVQNDHGEYMPEGYKEVFGDYFRWYPSRITK